MTTNTAATACPNCGAPSNSMARFCAECGKRIADSTPTISIMGVGLTLLFASVIWALAWTTQGSLIGSKPTQAFSTSASSTENSEGGVGQGHEQLEVASDPEIDKLRKDLEGAMSDPVKLNKVAADLVVRYHAIENPSKGIALELIDAFAAVLKVDKNNTSALFGMAEVSFDQQAFPKAVEFYERYLKIAPGEAKVRERYAASLTFVGRYKESISELEDILKKDPKNFSATAYLAIAYSENGQRDKALEIGNKALTFAPSDEAKERFGGFLEQIKTKGTGTEAAPDAANVRGNVPANAGASTSTAPVADGDGAKAIEAAIQQSPVAGPKFSRSEKKADGTLVLYFHDFPMDQMPPFAKDKFMSRIKEVGAAAKDVKKLSFVDEASGKEMDSLGLGSSN